MFQIKKIPDRLAQTDKGDFLWFGGTSYLGIPHHAEFKQLVKYGIDNYGSNWGSSRNNPLQLSIYDEVEAFLAKVVNAPSALTVSSGMLAGQMVLNYLQNAFSEIEIIYSPNVHPTLWASNYIPNKVSFQTFIENIYSQVADSKADVITIVADAVSSPHIEIYNFDWIEQLPVTKTINIVIDDSHSLGVSGENGGGIFSKIRHHENVNLFVVASLNKAFGVLGGVVFGEKNLLTKIRQTPFFAACSPISPAYAYACSKSGPIYQNELQILRQNIVYFNQKISNILNIINMDGHPAYSFQKAGLYEFLLTKNILVPSFAYPNPTDDKVTRLVISSLHTLDDLDYLSDCLLEFYQIY